MATVTGLPPGKVCAVPGRRAGRSGSAPRPRLARRSIRGVPCSRFAGPRNFATNVSDGGSVKLPGRHPSGRPGPGRGPRSSRPPRAPWRGLSESTSVVVLVPGVKPPQVVAELVGPLPFVEPSQRLIEHEKGRVDRHGLLRHGHPAPLERRQPGDVAIRQPFEPDQAQCFLDPLAVLAAAHPAHWSS